MRHCILPFVVGAFIFIIVDPAPVRAGSYQQTTLVTSGGDSDLINPWGIALGGATPFWVSDNGTGKSTLYNSAGVKQGLIVTMPAGSEPITGAVFNGSANFHADLFMFGSENGTIAGWRSALGTTAEQLYAVTGAIYKGLAITTAQDTLVAANFHAGTLDLFDSTHPAPIGSFADPAAPAGYAPFNVQNVGGKFYVTFAKQDAMMEDDVPGIGHGLIDVFDPVAHTFTRLVTGSDAGGTETALDSPWGVAVAPGTFGELAGDLLVGNFGDGSIHAFNPTTGALVGTLSDTTNTAILNAGLWGLTFGNGGNGGDPNALYLTAGGALENTGVFARISVVPEPSAITLIVLSCAMLVRRAKSI